MAGQASCTAFCTPICGTFRQMYFNERHRLQHALPKGLKLAVDAVEEMTNCSGWLFR